MEIWRHPFLNELPVWTVSEDRLECVTVETETVGIGGAGDRGDKRSRRGDGPLPPVQDFRDSPREKSGEPDQEPSMKIRPEDHNSRNHQDPRDTLSQTPSWPRLVSPLVNCDDQEGEQ